MELRELFITFIVNNNYDVEIKKLLKRKKSNEEAELNTYSVNYIYINIWKIVADANFHNLSFYLFETISTKLILNWDFENHSKPENALNAQEFINELNSRQTLSE